MSTSSNYFEAILQQAYFECDRGERCNKDASNYPKSVKQTAYVTCPLKHAVCLSFYCGQAFAQLDPERVYFVATRIIPSRKLIVSAHCRLREKNFLEKFYFHLTKLKQRYLVDHLVLPNECLGPLCGISPRIRLL